MIKDKCALTSRTCGLIFDNSDLNPSANGYICFNKLSRSSTLRLCFDHTSTTKFNSPRGVITKRSTARGCLWISESNSNVHPLLVRPQKQRLLVDRCNSAKSFGHHASLRTDPVFLAWVFRGFVVRYQRRHGTNPDNFKTFIRRRLRQHHHYSYG